MADVIVANKEREPVPVVLTEPIDASYISLDTTNFDNNLSSADFTVQLAMETINDLAGSGSVSPDPTFDSLTVSGSAIFNNTINYPISVRRLTSTSEAMSISVDDNSANFILQQDVDEDAAHSFIFDINSVSTGDNRYIFRDNGSTIFTILPDSVVSNVDLEVGTNAIIQDQESGGPNYFSTTYMKGAKIRSSNAGVPGDGYYTLSGIDSVGTLRFENTVSYPGAEVELRFDLTDEAIHVDNPIVIDVSGSGSSYPAIQITDGTDSISLDGSVLVSANASVATIIEPTQITGSPIIIMDKAEQDTNVLEIKDTILTSLTGQAYYLDLFPGVLYGNGTKFLSEVSAGDELQYRGELFIVDSVDSDTQLSASLLLFFGDQADATVYAAERTKFVIDSDGFIASNIQPSIDSKYYNGTDLRRWFNTYTDNINDSPVTNFETAYDHSQLTTGNPHSVAISDLDTSAFLLRDGSIELSADWDAGDYDIKSDSFTLPSGVEISEIATGRIRLKNPNPVYSSITESNILLGMNSAEYQWGASIDVTDNTGGGGRILYFMCTPLVADNKRLMLGGQSSAGIGFVNGGSVDDGVVEIYTHTAGAAECTGIVRVRGENAPTQTTDSSIIDPQFHVCANDTTLTHHIGLQHDRTDGELYTGAGDLKLSPASGKVDIPGIISSNTKAWDVTITAPGDLYSVDTQIPVAYTVNDLTITKIVVSTNTSSYEVAGDLKWASDLTSFTGATVINDFDTTSGVRTDSSITSGSVAAGKYVYLELDSAPNSAVTWMTVHVEWSYD